MTPGLWMFRLAVEDEGRMRNVVVSGEPAPRPYRRPSTYVLIGGPGH